VPHPSHRRRPALAAVFAAFAAAVALALAPAASHAVSNPDNYNCWGHTQKGQPLPGDSDAQVRYVFACDGPITGYQIQSNQPIGSFDTAPVALDGAGNAVTTDAFSCDGDIPGLAVNCVGVFTSGVVNAKWETVTGEFSVPGKVCDEPRADPLLTVVYATGDKTGKVTQHIAGPYDLGRPRDCKPSSGGRRIPKGGLTLSAPAPKPKHPAKKHKKPKRG
jgi:hypothetical protein